MFSLQQPSGPTSTPPAPERHNPYALVNWPTSNDQQKYAIPDIRALRYVPRPLLAFDQNCKQILPRMYDIILPSKFVSVKFELKRYATQTEAYDYFADIVELQVLQNIKIDRPSKVQEGIMVA